MTIDPKISEEALDKKKKIKRLEKENKLLWDALEYIDTYDPELTTMAEASFGIDVFNRTVDKL